MANGSLRCAISKPHQDVLHRIHYGQQQKIIAGRNGRQPSEGEELRQPHGILQFQPHFVLDTVELER